MSSNYTSNLYKNQAAAPLVDLNPIPNPAITEPTIKQVLRSSQVTSVQLLSGCLSGLITCVLFQPFDLLKTRQQQQTKILSIPQLATSNTSRNASFNKTSLRQLIQSILKQDGILGMWKGAVPTVFRSAPGTGLYFLTFEKLKLTVNIYKKDEINRTDQLICGSVARSFAGFILMPVSVIKTRVESNIYPGTFNTRQAARLVFQSQGIKGFFAGAGATALRDAPYAGIYIYFYQIAKGLLDNTSFNPPCLIKNLSAGIGAGFAATLVTHPFDVVKTRMQLDKVAYPTIISALKSLAGPDLGRGLLMRLARKSLSSGITWAGYEHLVHYATLTLLSN